MSVGAKVEQSILKRCKVISVKRICGSGKLKAFADLSVAHCFIIRNCAVLSGHEGIYASLPRNISKDGTWRDVVRVTDPELKKHYCSEIVKAYEKVACPQ